jgi:HEAT repeat protein
MSHLRLFPASFVTFLLLACAGLAQTPPTVQPEETDLNKLAAVLRSDAPYAQKLLACKRLARLGNKESVAALAPLLADPQLSHPARLALEAITDPGAGDALRGAVGRLKGQPLVGVIHSLGVRRDPQAVTLVERLLADPDAEVAGASAWALGKIGTPEAVAILGRSLAVPVAAVRNAVADACLDAAEQLQRQGKSEAAIALFDQVAKADLPARVRAAAERGAILVKASAGGDRLAAELQSPDAARFAMALTLAREIRDPIATQTLLAQLPKLPPARQALVLTALGDRADAAARPVAVQAAASADAQVRVAAMRALATLGNPSDVPLLLAGAAEADRAVADAALDSLAALPGIDASIVGALGQAQGKSRLILFDVVGRRQIAAAVPALLAALDAKDAATRMAAIGALGGTIAPHDFSSLTKRLLTTGSPEEQAAAQRALRLACSRRPDKRACAEALVASLAQAPPVAKRFLLELLGTVGGPTALDAVAAAAMDADEEIQDTATRVLGDWPTPDVAAALLEVARKSPSERFRVRALRGYLRVARQMDVSAGQKVVMCRQAIALAQRNEERILAIETLGRYASPEALKLAVAQLGSEPLRAAASTSVVSIGEMIVGSYPQQVAAAMQEVLKTTRDKNLTRRATEALRQATARSAGK